MSLGWPARRVLPLVLLSLAGILLSASGCTGAASETPTPAVVEELEGSYLGQRLTVKAGRRRSLPRTDHPRILQLIAEGKSNSDISTGLYLSPKTVRNHISNIFAKLRVADRAQAIVRAREAGLGGLRDD